MIMMNVQYFFATSTAVPLILSSQNVDKHQQLPVLAQKALAKVVFANKQEMTALSGVMVD